MEVWLKKQGWMTITLFEVFLGLFLFLFFTTSTVGGKQRDLMNVSRVHLGSGGWATKTPWTLLEILIMYFKMKKVKGWKSISETNLTVSWGERRRGDSTAIKERIQPRMFNRQRRKVTAISGLSYSLERGVNNIKELHFKDQTEVNSNLSINDKRAKPHRRPKSREETPQACMNQEWQQQCPLDMGHALGHLPRFKSIREWNRHAGTSARFIHEPTD